MGVPCLACMRAWAGLLRWRLSPKNRAVDHVNYEKSWSPFALLLKNRALGLFASMSSMIIARWKFVRSRGGHVEENRRRDSPGKSVTARDAGREHGSLVLLFILDILVTRLVSKFWVRE